MISTVKVAAVQMNSLPYDKAGNLALAEGLVRQAAEAGAKLVVLPELFNTGYQVADQDYALSEPVPGGETVRWMEELSARHQLYLVAAIIERSACEGVLYDTCVLTGPEGYVGKYRKVCLWGAESLRFRSGHEYPVFDLGFARLGMQICYEVGFPEGARILTLNGANLLAYSAAFGRRRSYVWELASRARALCGGGQPLRRRGRGERICRQEPHRGPHRRGAGGDRGGKRDHRHRDRPGPGAGAAHDGALSEGL